MKSVGIAQLKAHLSIHLRRVRRGASITVMHRNKAIARIVPYGLERDLSVRTPRRRYASLQQVPLPPPLPRDAGIVDLLLADREGGS